MSVDLTNISETNVTPEERARQKFSNGAWAELLSMAWEHGWKPLGTEEPGYRADLYQGEPWSGTYVSNDGQIVTSADARALADGLERALGKVPNGWWHEQIEEFIAFCRKGEFNIW